MIGKQNWEKFLAIDFHISVTKCERKYIAFASKLLQTQTKSITLTNCDLQQKALYYRLWLFDWYLTVFRDGRQKMRNTRFYDSKS